MSCDPVIGPSAFLGAWEDANCEIFDFIIGQGIAKEEEHVREGDGGRGHHARETYCTGGGGPILAAHNFGRVALPGALLRS